MISPTHDTHHPRRHNRVTDTPESLPDAIPAGWGAPVLAFVLGVCLTVVYTVGIAPQGVHTVDNPSVPIAASTSTP